MAAAVLPTRWTCWLGISMVVGTTVPLGSQPPPLPAVLAKWWARTRSCRTTTQLVSLAQQEKKNGRRYTLYQRSTKEADQPAHSWHTGVVVCCCHPPYQHLVVVERSHKCPCCNQIGSNKCLTCVSAATKLGPNAAITSLWLAGCCSLALAFQGSHTGSQSADSMLRHNKDRPHIALCVWS